MRLQKGDYIRLVDLSQDQIDAVIDTFISTSFIDQIGMIGRSGFLGIDWGGEIVHSLNINTFGIVRRQLTYEQVVPIGSHFEEYTVSEAFPKQDNVNHPPHYTQHPSGVECIEITRHMGSNLGNAIKYIWRADLKNDAIEDLKKAVFYINDEIERRSNEK